MRSLRLIRGIFAKPSKCAEPGCHVIGKFIDRISEMMRDKFYAERTTSLPWPETVPVAGNKEEKGWDFDPKQVRKFVIIDLFQIHRLEEVFG